VRCSGPRAEVNSHVSAVASGRGARAAAQVGIRMYTRTWSRVWLGRPTVACRRRDAGTAPNAKRRYRTGWKCCPHTASGGHSRACEMLRRAATRSWRMSSGACRKQHPSHWKTASRSCPAPCCTPVLPPARCSLCLTIPSSVPTSYLRPSSSYLRCRTSRLMSFPSAGVSESQPKTKIKGHPKYEDGHRSGHDGSGMIMMQVPQHRH
jgi:hypothetical protein